MADLDETTHHEALMLMLLSRGEQQSLEAE
jgi:hypothetical protein